MPRALLCTAFAVSLLPLAAAAETMTTDSLSQVKYACDDNKVLDVVYVNTAAGSSYAIISQMDELIALEIVPMASGANYSAVDENYTYKLLTKGQNADLVEGDDVPVLSNCIEAQ